MDVLGYSLEEIGGVIGQQHTGGQGRAASRPRPPARAGAGARRSTAARILAEPQRSLLAAYVERFNARDFDAIRDMLADEVRLELVARTRMNGRSEVRKYFHNYALAQGLAFCCGPRRRPAGGARASTGHGSPRAPAYFVLLEWVGERVMRIRDFLLRALRDRGRGVVGGAVKGQQCCPGADRETLPAAGRAQPRGNGLERYRRNGCRLRDRIRSCEADRSSARKAAVTFRIAAAAIVPCLA